MTFLVLVLTILYWFAVVAVVFGLLYLPFQNSSTLGYAFGIIYYYSIVDILLVNDVSKEVYQVVTILSSFAKLTPPMFGQLCFAEGLSWIDQQFIHYCHALAVSLIVLVIILVYNKIFSKTCHVCQAMHYSCHLCFDIACLHIFSIYFTPATETINV